MFRKLMKTIFFGTLIFSSPIPVYATKSSSCESEPTLCEDLGFKRIQGTANSSTTWWIIGELHQQITKNKDCIEQLTQESIEHRILFEGMPAGKKVPCKKRGLEEKKWRECMGWDDMENHEESLKLFPNLELERYVFLMREAFEKWKVSDKEMDDFVKLIPQKEAKNKRLEAKIAHDFIFKYRKQGLSYKEIFSDPAILDQTGSILSASDKKLLKAINKKRNASLLKTLNQSPHVLTVAFTGIAHVKANQDDTGAAEYLLAELAKKDDNYYAVLAIEDSMIRNKQ